MYGIGAIGICAGVMALLLGIFLEDDTGKYNTDAVSTCSIVFVLVGDNCHLVIILILIRLLSRFSNVDLDRFHGEWLLSFSMIQTGIKISQIFLNF
jgi:hypothetical protein